GGGRRPGKPSLTGRRHGRVGASRHPQHLALAHPRYLPGGGGLGHGARPGGPPPWRADTREAGEPPVERGQLHDTLCGGTVSPAVRPHHASRTRGDGGSPPTLGFPVCESRAGHAGTAATPWDSTVADHAHAPRCAG